MAIGSDHAGFQLKTDLVEFLKDSGIACVDVGAATAEPTDYPDYAQRVSQAVLSEEADRGIMVCGTGIGSCIAANKVDGIRAALCHDPYSARMSRSHNDANVLCLGERVIGTGLAREIVSIWLAEEFSGDARHRRRLREVSRLETAGVNGEQTVVG